MIQVYRGAPGSGTLVREIRSHVDTATCLTPLSSIDVDYPNGSNFGVTMVPDLVKEPGGIEDPNNKVVVTEDYYAGVILGGATKDFDTTYTDSDGMPLADLTEGTYTIVVTGLSCDLAGQTATKQISMGLTHASLGRFSPESSKQKLIEFTEANGYRIYFDYFPGYFGFEGNLYEIKDRWMPNNSIEVANDLAGTVVDTVAAAVNDLLVYNVRDTSATNTVEIGALVHNGLVESANTVFHHYDIGEPEITYVDEGGQSVSLDGQYATFGASPLVITRVEIQAADASTGDNLYNTGDTTPKELDLDVADGVTVGPGEEFNVFGVVTPIPSETSPGEHDHEYMIANRIAQVRYDIRDGGGTIVDTQTKEVDLARIYDPTDPTWLSNSIYEFMHELTIESGAGVYTVELVGLDADGAEVGGTAQSFTVTVTG